MPLGTESPRIVIAGASSLLGAELRQQLEESRFAAADFRLVDEELAAGTLTEAGGEPAVIQPAGEDSFERARFVFFTGSPAFARLYLAAAQQSGAAVIDLSGGTLSAPGARPWFAGEEDPPANAGVYEILSAPGTVAVKLIHALRKLELRRLALIFFRPVSEAGRPGIEELESQTSQLLSFQSVGQAVFGTQVAFSLLNGYGARSAERLSETRARIRAEAGSFASKGAVEPSIQVLHAPVFYGYTFAAIAEVASIAKREKISEACESEGIVVAREEDGPPGNLTAAGDAAIHVAPPEPDAAQAGTWWLWGVADNIKLPVASAVKLAEKLL